MSQDAPNPQSPRDLIDRMDVVVRETMVLRAIEACRPGNRPGSRSGLWTAVSTYHLNELAKHHLIGHLPAKEAAAKVGRPFKGVGSRVIDRWLKLVRDEYTALINRRLEEAGSSGQALALTGDLAAQIGIVWGALMVKVTTYINQIDWNDISNADRHVIMRFMESLSDAAKIQTEARRTEAQTDAILARMRSVCQTDKGSGSSKTAAERLKEASTLIDELVGLTKPRALA